MKKVLLLSAITTITVVSALLIVKPILFTKADTCISASPTGCNAPTSSPDQTPTTISLPTQAQQGSNTTSVTAPSPQPTATSVPIQSVQTQTTQPQNTSCHQVCQEVCQ